MTPSSVQLSPMRNHTFPTKTLHWLSHSLRQAQTFLPQPEQIPSSLQTFARRCGRPSPLFSSSSGGWHALTLKAVTDSFVYGVPCFFLSLWLRVFFLFFFMTVTLMAKLPATAIYFIQAPTRIPKWSRLRAKYPQSTHKLVTTLAVMGG